MIGNDQNLHSKRVEKICLEPAATVSVGHKNLTIDTSNHGHGHGMETYSRIGLLRSYGNLQSYWTTTKLWKLTVVLDYYEAM